jgi:DNA mismatch repair ATPase MutS
VEVERVLNIVRAADTSPKLVALFDELFRGTNSEERVAISRALLRYLGRRGVLVLAATHDRALADLVTIDRENGMANHHLRETVESGVMRFDYRLRDGVVSTRNAIRVLESLGYPEALVSEARQAAGEASPRRDDS